MRILFAAPDRDLIRCYGTLLDGPDRTVETAFDGVQVLRLLSEGDWDLLILSRDIPRIDWRRIVEHRSLEGPPILLLSAEPPDLRFLRDKALPNACLPLPFLPEELEAVLQRLRAALNSEVVMELEGRELPVSGFRLGKARLILNGGGGPGGSHRGPTAPRRPDGPVIPQRKARRPGLRPSHPLPGKRRIQVGDGR